MNMHVSTPTERLLYAAHQERVKKFWPAKAPTPTVVEIKEIEKARAVLDTIHPEWFKLAWELLSPSTSDRVTIEQIKREVCDHFGVNLNELISPRRSPTFSTPRMVVMYLSKNLTSKSFPEIGRRLGDRDHTTIMHGAARIKVLMKRDEKLAASVEFLAARLSA